jgi:uncharacterized protein YuzE
METYEYEEDLDILYVYNNPDKEKAEDSLVLGNIVIDIGKDGKVLGAEIDCASKLFNFPPEQLNNLSKAIIQVLKIGNMLTLGIVIATPVKEHSFQFAIQQEQKQMSRIPISAC